MKSKRQKKLLSIIIGAHVLSLFTLWIFLDNEEKIELEFQKIISVRITNTPMTKLPPINQSEREKIEEEKRQKKEAEEKRRRDEIAKKKKIEDQKKERS